MSVCLVSCNMYCTVYIYTSILLTTYNIFTFYSNLDVNFVYIYFLMWNMPATSQGIEVCKPYKGDFLSKLSKAKKTSPEPQPHIL